MGNWQWAREKEKKKGERPGHLLSAICHCSGAGLGGVAGRSVVTCRWIPAIVQQDLGRDRRHAALRRIAAGVVEAKQRFDFGADRPEMW
jgi:hypothetical protein